MIDIIWILFGFLLINVLMVELNKSNKLIPIAFLVMFFRVIMVFSPLTINTLNDELNIIIALITMIGDPIGIDYYFKVILLSEIAFFFLVIAFIYNVSKMFDNFKGKLEKPKI